MKWQQIRIGDCCQIISGSTPSRNKKEYWGGKINWFTPKDLSNLESKYIFESPEKITLSGYKSCSTTILPAQSLFLSSRAPIGHIAINKIEACTNQGFKSLIPSNKVDINYLYYTIKSIVPNLKDLGNGATFKELSKATLSKVEIPLPPLSTQKKIAAILDKADALRQNDKKILEKYDQLAGSVFLEMFGDPVRNEKGWRIVLFGDIIEDIVGGKSFGGDYRSMKVGEMAVLKISSVTSGEFDSTQYKVVNEISSKINLIKPREGDLLFSRANTRELVGATCIVDKNYDQLFLPDKLWRLDLNQRLALNYYIKFLLSDTKFRGTLTKKATGTSGSMLNISKAKLRALPIPLPRLDLQTQFQASIKKIEEQKEYTRISLQKSEELFQSLLQRAFSGELG